MLVSCNRKCCLNFLLPSGKINELDSAISTSVCLMNVLTLGRAMPDTVSGLQDCHIQLILAIVESHTDTITNITFHPSLPFPTAFNGGASSGIPSLCLMSSSTDGLVTIIDPTINEEDDAVVTVLNNRSAIQHFQPIFTPRGDFDQKGFACIISQDEKLSVHAITPPLLEEEPVDPKTFDLREELKCDYTISLKLSDGDAERCRKSPHSCAVLAVGACKEYVKSEIAGRHSC